MIQRKQTLWLLLAALVSSGVFYFALYTGHINSNGTDTEVALRVGPSMPLVLIAIVMTALPLVAIFMYANRKRQRMMTLVSVLACSSFITMAMSKVNAFIAAPENAGMTNDSYWIGSILPFVSMVFLILAMFGIKKDEKLVKSLDRLR